MVDDIYERILAAIRRVAEETGSDQVSVDDYVRYRIRPDEPSQITAIRRFGSWSNAVSAAGLRPNLGSRGKRVSDAEALAAVRTAAAAYAKETGRPKHRMTQAYYNGWRAQQPDENHLGLAVLADRFGGWADVLSAAKLVTTPVTPRAANPSRSDREVLAAVRRAAADYSRETGKPQSALTQAYYNTWRVNDEKALSATALERRFGRWSELKSVARVPSSVAKATTAPPKPQRGKAAKKTTRTGRRRA